MSENKKIHYKGKSAIDIGVGEFRQSFKPGETATIEDARFRNELLDRDDFTEAMPRARPAGKRKQVAVARTPRTATPVVPEPSGPAPDDETGPKTDDDKK